jgi:ubiquinone/menaquinone biosynthesis C-methylase UbiE
MRPHGTMGKIFGWRMGRRNRPAYDWTVQQLRPVAPKSILEIGFGTGHLMALAAQDLKPARIAGVDPSELMVETARKRLAKIGSDIPSDLKQGDDTALPKDGPFDAIVALHSFQFWAQPAETLANIRAQLAPRGRFVIVIQLRTKRRSKAPNPLSRRRDEISRACAAFETAGFVILGMGGISKTSHGIVLGCG